MWEQAGAVSSSDLADNQKIGEGIITGLPPLPRGSPVDVTFRMNETGLLRVEALELKTGKKLNIELQIGGLSPAQVSEAASAIARYAVTSEFDTSGYRRNVLDPARKRGNMPTAGLADPLRRRAGIGA